MLQDEGNDSAIEVSAVKVSGTHFERKENEK
jgi:hypothetical protein